MVDRGRKPSAIPVSPLAPTPQVSMSDDNSRVIATLPSGDRAEILLYGATIISWRGGNGKENLFLSEKAVLDGSKPVRGGVPLVFPVFGPPPPNHATSSLPQHGFARNTKWEYLGKTSSESSSTSSSGDSSVKLDFGLSDPMLDAKTKAAWDHKFNVTYSITLSPGQLGTSMLVRNTAETAWEFKVLFHTYFKINDITKTQVTGLESTPYIDKVAPSAGATKGAAQSAISFSSETDRVYAKTDGSTNRIEENGEATLEIVRDGLGDVVVWNPWSEKAAGMSDFAPKDGWKEMICVEAGSVSGWIALESGDTWEGGQTMRAL
ncbi:hypothetical protein MMC25_007986 [Agyrium rufum]|nr:hypothetical protein [Agyrium rufum]